MVAEKARSEASIAICYVVRERGIGVLWMATLT